MIEFAFVKPADMFRSHLKTTLSHAFGFPFFPFLHGEAVLFKAESTAIDHIAEDCVCLRIFFGGARYDSVVESVLVLLFTAVRTEAAASPDALRFNRFSFVNEA